MPSSSCRAAAGEQGACLAQHLRPCRAAAAAAAATRGPAAAAAGGAVAAACCRWHIAIFIRSNSAFKERGTPAMQEQRVPGHQRQDGHGQRKELGLVGPRPSDTILEGSLTPYFFSSSSFTTALMSSSGLPAPKMAPSSPAILRNWLVFDEASSGWPQS